MHWLEMDNRQSSMENRECHGTWLFQNVSGPFKWSAGPSCTSQNVPKAAAQVAAHVIYP